jgi:hypothetical protein
MLHTQDDLAGGLCLHVGGYMYVLRPAMPEIVCSGKGRPSMLGHLR